MFMNNNSMAITILCSKLCLGENINPLKTDEWSTLASLLLKRNIQPYELLEFSSNDFSEKLSMNDKEINRIENLISRSGSIAFDLEKLSKMGIHIVTRADKKYPQILKKRLRNECPPLFYSVGNLELLNKQLVGVIGSKSVNDKDIDFTKNIVKKVTDLNMGIICGGSKGIESIAAEEAIEIGGFAVEYISHSLLKKVKNSKTINAIRNDKLLILSLETPDAVFNTELDNMCNKYIYASSIGMVVIKSDVENIYNNWSNTYCWNNKKYTNNIELIKNGATPIDNDWDIVQI